LFSYIKAKIRQPNLICTVSCSKTKNFSGLHTHPLDRSAAIIVLPVRTLAASAGKNSGIEPFLHGNVVVATAAAAAAALVDSPVGQITLTRGRH
jgi:hypothetical protein